MKRKHADIYNDNFNRIEVSEAQVITKEIFRQKIISFIIGSDQPFTIVENPFFVDLINYCSGGNEACNLFSADTVDKLFVDMKGKVKTALQNNRGKISFITDCWTSSNQHPFQGVIARWISDDWELNNSVIDLTKLHGSHKGKNLAKEFWNVLVDYCRKVDVCHNR